MTTYAYHSLGLKLKRKLKVLLDDLLALRGALEHKLPRELLLGDVQTKTLGSNTLRDSDAGSGLGGDPEVEMGRHSGSNRDTFGSWNSRGEWRKSKGHPRCAVVDLTRDQRSVGARHVRQGWLLLV